MITFPHFLNRTYKFSVKYTTPLWIHPHKEVNSTLLLGDIVHTNKTNNPFTYVQNQYDGEKGYVQSKDLFPSVITSTHKIVALSAPVYIQASIYAPISLYLPMGSEVCINHSDHKFSKLTHYNGYVANRHIRLLSQHSNDSYVDYAVQFLHTPYVWGGKTPRGIDCSGLVQLSLSMVNTRFPRNTKNQIRTPLLIRTETPKSTDLLFWKGHVGIVYKNTYLLHANAHTMGVHIEPIEKSMKRITSPFLGFYHFRIQN